MRAHFAAISVMMLLVTSAQAFQTPPSDAKSVMEKPLQRLETADYRATGHLVRVDASGTRTSFAIALKVRWFPGVLRIFADIQPPASSPNLPRVHALLAMRLHGTSSIQVAHPGDKSPAALPFDQWNSGPLGPGFSFEDFFEPQFYWSNQSVSENIRYGARDCDLLTSIPGAEDRTHYAKIKSWLDHAIGYPVYVEKTLKGTGTVKEFSYFGLRQTGGVWSASQVEEKIEGQPGSTLLIIERGSTKANLDLKDFSPEQLTRF
jgi:hypothetical protein